MWQLASFGVELRGATDDHRFYRAADVLRAENDDAAAGVLDAMVAHLRASAARVAGAEPQVLSRGRYKGRKLSTLMSAATRGETEAFLLYVIRQPSRYAGRVIRLDEAYASWLIQGAPYSASGLADALIAAKTDEERANLWDIDAHERGAVASELLRRVRLRSEVGETEAALSVLQLASKLIDDRSAFEVRLEHELTLGVLVGAAGQWDAAVERFGRALKACVEAKPVPANRPWIESQSALRLGKALARVRRHQQAVGLLRYCARVQLENGDDLETRGMTTLALAEVYRDQSEFKSAIETFAAAIDQFRQVDSLERMDTALAGRAQALGKLGRTREALRHYQTMLRGHMKADDAVAIAETRQHIGQQYWSHGAYLLAIPEYKKALATWERRGNALAVANAQESLSLLAAGLGNYEDAKRLNALARAGFAAQKQIASEWISVADGGWFRTALGDYAGGLAVAEEALAQLQKLDFAYAVIFVRNRIAMVLSRHHEFEKARAYYSTSVEEARKIDDRSTLAATLSSRAAMSLRLRDFEAVRRDLDEAIRIVRATGALGSEVEYRLLLAQGEQQRGEAEVAHREADHAIRLAKEIDNVALLAQSMRQKGNIWRSRYASNEAESCFRRAIQLYSDPMVRDVAGAARAMLDLSSELHDQGLWEDALATVQYVRTYAVVSMSREVQREADLMLARMYRLRGSLQEAARILDQLEADPQLQDWQKADVLLERAKVLQDAGAGEDALQCARKAERLSLAQRNDWGSSSAGFEIARILRLQGDYDAATLQLKRTRPYSLRTGDLDHIASLDAWAGEIALARGDVGEAAESFEKAYAVAKKMASRTRLSTFVLNLGSCRRRQGRNVEARKHLEEAATIFLALESKSWEARARLELVRLDLAEGTDAQAAEQLTRVEQITDTAVGPIEVVWQYWFLRSRIEERRGDLDDALRSRKRSILHLSSASDLLGADPERRRRFLLSKVDVYESAAELIGKLVEREKDTEAEEKLVEEMATFMERARFEVLRSGEQRGGSEVVDKILKDIQRLQRRSDTIRKRIEEARKKGQKELEKRLDEVLAENKKQLGELFDNLRAKDKQFEQGMNFKPRWFKNWKRLPPNARLVIYFPSHDGLHLMVYGPEGFIVWKRVKKATSAELREQVFHFHDLLGNVARESVRAKGRGFGPLAEANEKNPDWYRKNCAETREVLRQLHDWLIAPIEEYVGDAEPLIIMPYASLCYLPFGALLGGDGRFLGERQTISYLVHQEHMREALDALRDPPHTGPDYWVAFGDPVGKLASSLGEVEEIRAHFPNHRVHTRFTGDATVQQLLATPSECTILHLATHGYLNGTEPSKTYLEFAPDDVYAGKLEQAQITAEVADNLACLGNGSLRLIVLSACDTARGPDDPNAEVLAIPNSFLSEGAPSVVASLWKVNTWATGSLMAEFYERLTGSEPGPGLALRGARQALANDRANGRYAHPYYWASFILFGEWR